MGNSYDINLYALGFMRTRYHFLQLRSFLQGSWPLDFHAFFYFQFLLRGCIFQINFIALKIDFFIKAKHYFCPVCKFWTRKIKTKIFFVAIDKRIVSETHFAYWFPGFSCLRGYKHEYSYIIKSFAQTTFAINYSYYIIWAMNIFNTSHILIFNLLFVSLTYKK